MGGMISALLAPQVIPLAIPPAVPLLLIGGLGTTELLITLFIVILVFGAGKLPQLGAGLGEGIRNFRKSMRSLTGGSDGGEASGSRTKDD